MWTPGSNVGCPMALCSITSCAVGSSGIFFTLVSLSTCSSQTSQLTSSSSFLPLSLSSFGLTVSGVVSPDGTSGGDPSGFPNGDWLSVPSTPRSLRSDSDSLLPPAFENPQQKYPCESSSGKCNPPHCPSDKSSYPLPFA